MTLAILAGPDAIGIQSLQVQMHWHTTAVLRVTAFEQVCLSRSQICVHALEPRGVLHGGTPLAVLSATPCCTVNTRQVLRADLC